MISLQFRKLMPLGKDSGHAQATHVSRTFTVQVREILYLAESKYFRRGRQRC